ncbi:MAG: ArsC family (seleno)protein, partial [Gemmatimonadota bacterium]|nr:ArsC family (seleno)protein [Gemmatimonadota bacterium]
RNGIVDGAVQNATKEPVLGEAALDALDGIAHLRVAKGSKVLHFDLAHDRPTNKELLGVLLGRSGKLRAPTIRTRATLLVGYNRELLEAYLTR